MGEQPKINMSNQRIEMKFSALQQIGGGGPSVQPDWNQTVSTAADFIKNRPFGKAELCGFSGDCDFVMSEGAPAPSTDMIALSFGEATADQITIDESRVVVIVDGVRYELSTTVVDGFYYFGNMGALGGEDTGEPYLGMWSIDTFMIADLTATESVTHNVSFYIVGDKKIDSKNLTAGVTLVYAKKDADGVLRLHQHYNGDVITRDELRNLVSENDQMLFVCYNNTSEYAAPIAIKWYANTHGFVDFYITSGTNDTTRTIVRAYTAEYTAST